MDDFADLYPVSNSKVRPGIGRAYDGTLSYNCFAVRLSRDENGAYLPFTFSGLVGQLDTHPVHWGVCTWCIFSTRLISFGPAHRHVEVDPASEEFAALLAEAKVNPDLRRPTALGWRVIRERGEAADPSAYCYCPLVHAVLAQSPIWASEGSPDPDLPPELVRAIRSGNSEDTYLLRFARGGAPQRVSVCPVLTTWLLVVWYGERLPRHRRLPLCQIVSEFLFPLCASAAEKAFLRLWMLSMWAVMDAVAANGPGLGLGSTDLAPLTSKVLGFVVPVPQVWVRVIAPPPPGTQWDAWNRRSGVGDDPQRVDFLVVYAGRRHIIELDDTRHYGEEDGAKLRASERQYRKTLRNTRLLESLGYVVHRFTNGEVLELDREDGPDTDGFLRLLQSEGLDPVALAFPAVTSEPSPG